MSDCRLYSAVSNRGDVLKVIARVYFRCFSLNSCVSSSLFSEREGR